jgi:hypothetical protein
MKVTSIQFDFELIPLQPLTGQPSTDLIFSGDADERPSEFWISFQKIIELENRLDQIAVRQQPWSNEMIKWGDSHFDCMTLVWTEGKQYVRALTGRFALRNISIEFVCQVSLLAQEFGLMFVSSQVSLISPDPKSIWIAICTSQKMERLLRRTMKPDFLVTQKL